jgi:predicted NBD/HSP70 family sugar kinase
MVSLGIDIGGTSVKAAAVRDGQVVWTAKSSRYQRPTTEQIIAAVGEVAGGREADAVGICCPGLLDRATRRITLSVNVPGLVGVPLDDIVTRGVGVQQTAAILSDANAVGYDVYASGGLTGRLLCLSLGTGVGASVVDEGGFLHVSGESPGHFGQLDVSLDDRAPIGPDGGAGSLEAYIGAGALGDSVGRLTVEDAPVRALVRAIRLAHAIYRPQHVCLTGGVGIRLKRLVPEIKAAVELDLTRVARGGWTLFTGENDYHAACGVARWAVRGVAAG